MAASNTNSLEHGTLIGKGLTSDVFAWGEQGVLKVYHPRVPRDYVEREFSITRALHSAGLPVPAAIEILTVEGRHAIVLQRLQGISMFKAIQSRPWKFFSGARQLAELHAQLHTFAAPPELPTQRDQIQRWIDDALDFSSAQKQAAQFCLDRMPVANIVCHGDFHPENIILTERGPMIIDWSTGTSGHPLGDVCRTTLLIESAEIPADTPFPIRHLINLSRRLLLRAYLKRYLELRGASEDEVQAWRPAQLAGSSVWRNARII